MSPPQIHKPVDGQFHLASLTLHAAPKTDLWRKPSSPPVESHNAPHNLISVPIDHFSYAEVTVSAPWTRLYDQGGLVIFPPSTSSTVSTEANRPWIKTGIEFYEGATKFSTVSTQSSASDWSLVPLGEGKTKVTVRIEREVEKDGSLSPSLWVYVVDKEKGSKVAVREVTWVFANADQGGEFQVGAYCARPTGLEGDSAAHGEELLEVTFTDLFLQTHH